MSSNNKNNEYENLLKKIDDTIKIDIENKKIEKLNKLNDYKSDCDKIYDAYKKTLYEFLPNKILDLKNNRSRSIFSYDVSLNHNKNDLSNVYRYDNCYNKNNLYKIMDEVEDIGKHINDGNKYIITLHEYPFMPFFIYTVKITKR